MNEGANCTPEQRAAVNDLILFKKDTDDPIVRDLALRQCRRTIKMLVPGGLSILVAILASVVGFGYISDADMPAAVLAIIMIWPTVIVVTIMLVARRRVQRLIEELESDL